jgi:hypothetical protein
MPASASMSWGKAQLIVSCDLANSGNLVLMQLSYTVRCGMRSMDVATGISIKILSLRTKIVAKQKWNRVHWLENSGYLPVKGY